ncbi:isocitrate lyase/phosphoenolpyruvate mutase family protein [Streptomyces sp. Wb2n-11]|uniref:isocitrate lyase/phosphoenolpyruvate mutase family protein n=1 Tax=Streptomyces sp. Wb2n-11 TaxID=1030533 RepID=UPI000B8A25F1|nr:isocitrate lyase/phosphoenolpyruvate mutase family protein [Streptomyces sp. Wb2n-11]
MAVDVRTKEKALRLCVRGEEVLVLPSAWDAGSAAVDVPVTGEAEGGCDDVAATVRGVAAAGAAGISPEESRAAVGPLFTAGEQAERVRAVRAVATGAGLPDLVVNARTGVCLFGIGEEGGRLAGVTAGTAAEAGAAEAGVRRISVGTGVTQAAYTAARDAALELLGEGSYGALDGSLDGSPGFSALNGLSSR